MPHLRWLGLIGVVGCTDQGVTAFNAAPLAEILSPQADAVLSVGSEVELLGSVSDPDHEAADLHVAWEVNGAAVCEETGSSGRVSCALVVPAADDVFSIRLIVTDPLLAAHADEVTVGMNARPGVPQLTIAPEAPNDSDGLTCVVTVEATDTDGDALEYMFSWLRNGVPTGFAGDAVDADSTEVGDEWVCQVVASDGSAEGDAAQTAVSVGPDPDEVGFLYSGADQTFSVPEGVYEIQVEAWGAGGAGGGGVFEDNSTSDFPSGWTDYGAPGGGGGFVAGTIAVEPGQELTVVVGGGGISDYRPFGQLVSAYGGGGRGGNASSMNGGGGGGGRTALLLDGAELLTAGGGGGGACSSHNSSNGAGGAGGGTIGLAGENGDGLFSTSHVGTQGEGGTGQAGGDAGESDCEYLSQSVEESGGSKGVGGDASQFSVAPGQTRAVGGGGGGGYFGGGSGGGACSSDEDPSAGAGGGGGSSYFGEADGAETEAGDGQLPGGLERRSDATVGVGGDFEADGGPGMMVIAWGN